MGARPPLPNIRNCRVEVIVSEIGRCEDHRDLLGAVGLDQAVEDLYAGRLRAAVELPDADLPVGRARRLQEARDC